MDKKSTVSWIVTIILTIAGLYVGFKHYKEQGFWWGVLALILIGSYVSVEGVGTKMRVGAPEYSLD